MPGETHSIMETIIGFLEPPIEMRLIVVYTSIRQTRVFHIDLAEINGLWYTSSYIVLFLLTDYFMYLY